MIQSVLALILSAYVFAQSSENLQIGEYMVHAAGCVDCHSAKQSPPFSGGLALVTPFGTFYTPNITPDDETGIGHWTEADFVRALRTGRSPKGEPYYPAFPYRSYTKLTDQDLHNMYEYLRTIPAVHKSNRAHALNFPYDQHWALYLWQDAFHPFNGLTLRVIFATVQEPSSAT